ncbi:MAG: ferredoxin family protein [Desulfobacteraceae bacterium]|nr:ferredoxin family protein [Desulfobacteraceae bacterium]
MFKVLINFEKCKGCGLCLLNCKGKVLRISSKINDMGYATAEVAEGKKCVGCKSCYLMCPEGIIEISKKSIKE